MSAIRVFHGASDGDGWLMSNCFECALYFEPEEEPTCDMLNAVLSGELTPEFVGRIGGSVSTRLDDGGKVRHSATFPERCREWTDTRDPALRPIPDLPGQKRLWGEDA